MTPATVCVHCSCPLLSAADDTRLGVRAPQIRESVGEDFPIMVRAAHAVAPCASVPDRMARCTVCVTAAGGLLHVPHCALRHRAGPPRTCQSSRCRWCRHALTRSPHAWPQIDREVPNGVKWLEEFLPPDDYAGYAEVKSKVSTTLLTTGEHEYTRYGFRYVPHASPVVLCPVTCGQYVTPLVPPHDRSQLLERKCADILQPDVTWVGGLTECRRIVALCAAYDIPVRAWWLRAA